MLHNYRKLLYTIITNVAVATAAQFLSAAHARAGAGDLFATDPATHSVIVYALDGTMRTFATGLGSPQGLAFDKYGNLFVADAGTGDLYEFTADGTRSTFATGLTDPVGISFDGLAIDVAEQSANRIVHVLPDGTLKSTSYTITAPTDEAIGSLPGASPSPSPNNFIVSSAGLTVVDGVHTTTYSIAGGRGVAVDSNLNAFVSTTSGMIEKVATTAAMPTPIPFATGLTTPNGMAFRPKRYSDSEAGVGNLFVAETQAGDIAEYTVGGTRSIFATGGKPEFLAFELILPAKLLNISTRLDVETGDNVLIGGFIVTGTAPKNVIIRALGPSLANNNPPISGALQDPVLELHKPDGSVVVNDNWMVQSNPKNVPIIKNSGLAPQNPNESALFATLDPGAYTAIVRGKNNTTGIGMVEVYDIDKTVDSELGNISTRGLVKDGDDVMIGGFIIDKDQNAARVLVRGIGPSLANANPPIPNPLADPFLELHDVNGTTIASNDNWQDTARGEIEATGIAPSNPHESAILANLKSGNYTAIVHGAKNGTGVALVEIYHLP
jgi:hypothetical protein